MVLRQGIAMFAIEVADMNTLSENCTLGVERAVEVAVEMVIRVTP